MSFASRIWRLKRRSVLILAILLALPALAYAQRAMPLMWRCYWANAQLPLAPPYGLGTGTAGPTQLRYVRPCLVTHAA